MTRTLLAGLALASALPAMPASAAAPGDRAQPDWAPSHSLPADPWVSCR